MRRAVDARAPWAANEGEEEKKGRREEGKERRGIAARPIWKRLRVLREERNMRNGRRMEAGISREEWTDERNGEELSVVACV